MGPHGGDLKDVCNSLYQTLRKGEYTSNTKFLSFVLFLPKHYCMLLTKELVDFSRDLESLTCIA